MANKRVSDLLEDFSFRHAKIEQENERRRKEDPQIQELEEQKRALLAEKLKCAFFEGDSAALDAEIVKLEQAQDKLAHEKGIVLAYRCEKCQDTGFANGRYCVCFLREVYKNVYGAVDTALLEEQFENADMEIFDGEQQLPMGKTQRGLADIVYKICKEYVQDFPNTKRSNLLLRGKAGLGKSYLLNSIASAARGQDIDVCLIRAGALFDSFFRHRMGEEIPLSFLWKVDLLLIDDLGTEPMTQNVTTEYLFDLINRRMEAKKHSVIATNVENLQARYGERISSRLESRDYGILMLDGTDLRLNKKR